MQSGIWDFEFSAVSSARQGKYIVITVVMRPELIIANRNTINKSEDFQSTDYVPDAVVSIVQLFSH